MKAELTPEQLAATTASGPEILVEAGPGSGKTTVLVQRVLALIYSGHVDPSAIRVFVFTRAAAEEIRERLAAATRLGRFVDVTTFHAFAWRIIVEKRAQQGLEPFDVASAFEDEACTARLLDAGSGERLPAYRRPTREELRRQQMRLAAGEVQDPPYALQILLHRLAERRLVPSWALVPTALERDFTPSPESIRDAAHILIDEVQDCCAADLRLARLHGTAASIFAVGDPRQSIMEWRLAGPHHIADALRSPQRLALSRSHRFGPAIAAAANAIATTFGGAPIAGDANRDNEAAEIRTSSVQFWEWELWESLRGADRPNTAILCRTNAECAAIEALLGRERARHVAAAANVRLGEDADGFADAASSGRIAIATIHAAKGREWDRVVVPSSQHFPDGTPEDWRCLYVAATRARKELRVFLNPKASTAVLA